jgi:hypothetical protein
MQHLAIFLLVACGTAASETPAAAPTAAPAEAPPAEAPPAEAAPPFLVQGTITLPEGATATGQAVFVSLRAPGVRGPPLAAKKLPPGPFPLAFELTEADRPMANGPVPASFELKVTLDVDGDPMTKAPEDFEVVAPATLGGAGLAVVLAPRAL